MSTKVLHVGSPGGPVSGANHTTALGPARKPPQRRESSCSMTWQGIQRRGSPAGTVYTSQNSHEPALAPACLQPLQSGSACGQPAGSRGSQTATNVPLQGPHRGFVELSFNRVGLHANSSAAGKCNRHVHHNLGGTQGADVLVLQVEQQLTSVQEASEITGHQQPCRRQPAACGPTCLAG